MAKRILLLVPTQFESEKLELQYEFPETVTAAICGFGPVASAAAAATMLAKFETDHVMLIGIAGSLGNRIEVGNASSFVSVAIDGIGAGCGVDHVSAKQMGWSFLDIGGESIGDTLSLSETDGIDDEQLLTVCAASGSAVDANRRAEKFPNAIAEDMEGFGVALACRLADVPLTVIRGISNVAGDRDKANWEIDAALKAAAKLAKETVKELQ